MGRYLDILADLDKILPSLSHDELNDPFTALLYLTPRESILELLESAEFRRVGDGARLFRAQWQDIILAASKGANPDHVSNMGPKSVTAFLRHRELEYFSGFRRLLTPAAQMLNGGFYQESQGFLGFARLPVPMLREGVGRFFSIARRFRGFARYNGLKTFPIKRGGWV